MDLYELQLRTRIKTLEEQLETARLQLGQVKQERDTLFKEVVGDCHVCKNKKSDKCADCHFNVYAWNTHEDYWQWRGSCAENGGTT